MRAVIIDVDGTLADVSPFRHHVVLGHPENKGYKDFKSFHDASVDAEPHSAVVEIINALADDVTVLIVTARMRQWEKHTVWWLLLNDIKFDELYMRDDGDSRKDYIVKKEILESIRSEGYEILFAVDDNPNVIELWQEEGILTILVPGWMPERTPTAHDDS